ncbi:MAG TPA: B12-binding domain-containing protein [Acidimicrobiales bacterium]|nr:B12-binding domain-containing protein [Acidimicrobiales bacterium]
MPAGEFTIQEVADLLGVHYMTAYRYVRTGALPARQVGARWLVAAADVEALRAPRTASRPGRPAGGGVSSLVKARPHLRSRLVAGDEAGAWTLIHKALAVGGSPAAVYMDLLAPALQEVGDDWAAGRLQVAGEHRATAVAVRIVGRMGPLFARRGRPRGTVVVGVVAPDRHALPAAMLSDMVRNGGFQVLDLGADAPVESFVESAAGASRLVAVMIGATVTGMEGPVSAAVTALRSAGVAAPVLVGGAGVAGAVAARAAGATGWSGWTGRTALAALEAVAPVRRPPPRPVP